MAKGKRAVYALISVESGAHCGYIQMLPAKYDKTVEYKKYDKTLRKHVTCKTKVIKKAGTKALAR